MKLQISIQEGGATKWIHNLFTTFVKDMEYVLTMWLKNKTDQHSLLERLCRVEQPKDHNHPELF